MRTITATMAILVAMGLAFQAQGQGARLGFAEKDIPSFNIPRMAAPPTIDGTIDPGEWKTAMQIRGMAWAGSCTFYDRPHAFWVAWDAKHLYIAGRAHVMKGHILGKSRREKYTTGTVFDDAFEFGLSMENRNQKPGEAASFFKFILNYVGSGEYMKMYPSIGQYLYNWRPDMKIANRMYERDGAQWWEMEVAMDLTDLEMPVPNKVGDLVRILLAHDGKNPIWVWTSVPTASGYLESAGYPRGVLTDAQPYAQIEELTGLHDEKVALKTAVYNPSAKPARVKAVLRISNEGLVENKAVTNLGVNEERILEIPAGGMVRFDVDKAFPGFDYRIEGHPKFNQMQGVLDLRLTPADQPDAKPVISQHLVFRKDAEKKYLEYTANPVDFNMSVRFNPMSYAMWVEADTLDARRPAAELGGAEWAVTQGETVVAKGRLEQLVYDKYQGLTQLPALQPGKYTVTVSLLDKAGKAALTRTTEIEKKDEAKLFPEWWGKTYGNPEQLLKPFEALRAKGNTVTVTRRAYEFDNLGLPLQITANGGPVLTAPARIVLVVDGREYVVPTKPGVTFTEKRDWRCSFEGAPVEVAGVRFSAKGKIEQDGLVSLELTYGPKGMETAVPAVPRPAGTAGSTDADVAKTAVPAVLVQSLRIEWLVDDTWNNYLACMGVGGNYSARFIDAIPSGKGVVWSTLKDIGLSGSGMTVGNFYQNLWVGTEKRGLFWWANSDEGWVPDDSVPAHEVVRNGTTTVIRNNIIGTVPGRPAFELAKPRTIKFSYNASPFRKLTKGWRINQTSYSDGFSGGKYKVNWDTQENFFSILSPPFPDKKRWPEYYAYCKEQADGIKKSAINTPGAFNTGFIANGIALRGYMNKTVEPGLYGYFGADWIAADMGESLNKSYQDYMMHLQYRQVTEGGCRHFYYDISMCGKISRDVLAGFGYLLPDGRIQPSGTDATLRQWYMRADALMQEQGFYPNGISGHATQTIPLIALPFSQSIVDSEFPMVDPITVYPMNRMIALSCPENFGCNISHLGQMNPNWAAMHDSGGSAGGYPFEDPAFRNWGIEREDIEFVPYWRNQEVVKKIGKGLICSIWKRPSQPGGGQAGSAVLEIMNYGPDPEGAERARSVEMTLDLQVLGIPSFATATEGGPAGVGAERVRVKELLSDRLLPERYLSHLKWYQDLAGTPNQWDPKKIEKFRTDIQPTLDLRTGKLTGFDIQYHDQRYLVITWDAKPVEDAAWKEALAGELRVPALDWGIADAAPVASGLVTGVEGGLKMSAWKRAGSVMLLLENPTDKPVAAQVKLDIAKLSLQVTPDKLFCDFVQIYRLAGPSTARNAILDPTKDAFKFVLGGDALSYDGGLGLLVGTLKPGQKRLVCFDRY